MRLSNVVGSGMKNSKVVPKTNMEIVPEIKIDIVETLEEKRRRKFLHKQEKN